MIGLGVLAQACLIGRNLYLVDDPALAQEVNANVSEDGGPSLGATTADDGGGATGPTGPTDNPTDPRPDPNPGAPDAAADAAKPDVKPMCAGGTAVEVEPNGTVDVAKNLVVGKTCGALALGDTDWFTMDIPAGGMLRVSFEADGDARLLLQSAGGGVAFATGTGGAFNFSTEGRWNLRVVSDTGRTQSYALVRP